MDLVWIGRVGMICVWIDRFGVVSAPGGAVQDVWRKGGFPRDSPGLSPGFPGIPRDFPWDSPGFPGIPRDFPETQVSVVAFQSRFRAKRLDS